MSNPETKLLFVFRVKIPEHLKSAQTENVPFNKELGELEAFLLKEKPVGFEIRWNTRNIWPTDSEGYTWVSLLLSRLFRLF